MSISAPSGLESSLIQSPEPSATAGGQPGGRRLLTPSPHGHLSAPYPSRDGVNVPLRASPFLLRSASVPTDQRSWSSPADIS